MKKSIYIVLAFLFVIIILDYVNVIRDFHKIEEFVFSGSSNSINVIERKMSGEYFFLADKQYYFYAESSEPGASIRPRTLSRVYDRENMEFAINFFVREEVYPTTSSAPDNSLNLYMSDIFVDDTPCSLPCALYWLEDPDSGRYFVRVMSF